MIWDLLALQWAAVGGCALMAAGVAAAFTAEVVRECRRGPAHQWQPAGEWIARTPPAEEVWDIRRLVLGMTAEQVEDEIARMIAETPDRPA